MKEIGGTCASSQIPTNVFFVGAYFSLIGFGGTYLCFNKRTDLKQRIPNFLVVLLR